MPRSIALVLCLAAAVGGHAAGLDIKPVLTAEVLVEGVHQNNYTDANDDVFTRTDPNVYSDILSGLSMVGDDLFLGGADGLLVDPDTLLLTVPSSARSTHFQDSNSQMWIRAVLGTDVDIANRAQIRVSVVFDAEGGDETHLGSPGRNLGGVYLNEAWILLKELFLDDLSVRAGRQEFYLNLRRNRGAMLYDSRADNPRVHGWDGVRARYQWDNFLFTPYGFILDAAREERGIEIAGNGLVVGNSNSKDNVLVGIQVDWQPDYGADNRVFVTGGASLERNVVIRPTNPLAGRISPLIGDRLINYYGGIEIQPGSGLTIWGEGAMQDGSLDKHRDFNGFAWSAGLEWHARGRYDAVVGVQYDFHSGDRHAANGFYNAVLFGPVLGQVLPTFDKVLIANILQHNPDDSEFRNFVAPWEGRSDTFIVEHERYGELSEFMVGNLHGGKARLEYRLDRNQTLRLMLLGAWYALDVPGYDLQTRAAGANWFGQEYDASLSWRYTHHTTLNLMGGVFLPGLGYRQIVVDENPAARAITEEALDQQALDVLLNGAPTELTTLIDLQHPNLAADDPIIFLGINAQVVF